MAEDEFCSNCARKPDCKAVYQQLGQDKGPSVVAKAAKAFLLPIVVFIGGLVLFDKLLTDVIQGQRIRTAVVFLLGAGVSFIFVLIVKVIDSFLLKSKGRCMLEGESHRSQGQANLFGRGSSR
jgi:cytochrome b subunit of formate dehydrogenase